MWVNVTPICVLCSCRLPGCLPAVPRLIRERSYRLPPFSSSLARSTLKRKFVSKRLRQIYTRDQREPVGGIHATSQREICTVEYFFLGVRSFLPPFPASNILPSAIAGGMECGIVISVGLMALILVTFKILVILQVDRSEKGKIMTSRRIRGHIHMPKHMCESCNLVQGFSPEFCNYLETSV